MKKLETFIKKAESMENQVQQLRLEKQMKEGMIGKKQREKVDIVLNGLGGHMNEKKVEAINNDIAKLQNEVTECEERIALFEGEAKNILREDVEGVKEERQELLQGYDKQIEEFEQEVFKMKLEFLAKVHELQCKRSELQNEINEVNEAIRKIEPRDRGAKVKEVKYVQDNYKSLGVDLGPVGIQTSELHALTVPSSTYRKPNSLELYLKTGEVVRSEKEADKKLYELKE
jgi:uncharacterized coiled-coil DUF342 family protein